LLLGTLAVANIVKVLRGISPCDNEREKAMQKPGAKMAAWGVWCSELKKKK